LDPAARAWGSWFIAGKAEDSPKTDSQTFEESAESPKAARRVVSGSTPPGRFETFRGSMRWMSHAPALGLATPNGNDPLALERVLEVRRLYAPMEDWIRTSEARGVPSRVMDLLNVKALVAWDDNDLAPPAEHFRFIEAPHGNRFFENPKALPRFFLVGRVIEAGSPKEALAILKSPEFDPGQAAVVEGARPKVEAGEFAPVRVVRYEAEGVELEYESKRAAMLVSSETWYPGWRAWLDGNETPLVMVNAAFRGVAAPAGRHRVEMRYSPDSLKWGAAVSIMAVAGLFWAWRRQG
jgi:hypothetical protein